MSIYGFSMNMQVKILKIVRQRAREGFPMFNVQCGPMTNKEYQILPRLVAFKFYFLFNLPLVLRGNLLFLNLTDLIYSQIILTFNYQKGESLKYVCEHTLEKNLMSITSVILLI